MTAYYAIDLQDTDSKNHFLLDYHRGRVPAVDPAHTLGAISIKSNADVGEHVAASTRYLGKRDTPLGQVFDFLLVNVGGDIWVQSMLRAAQPKISDSAALLLAYTYLALDQLTPGSIAGQVLSGAEPTGVSGATVTITKGVFSKSTTSGALGVYAIEDVPVGTGYTVTAEKADHVTAAQADIEIEEAAETDQDLTMIAHGSVTGVTQDQDSTPLGGLTVTLTLADPPIHYETTSDAITGEFEFPSVVPNVGYTLASTKALYVDASETINVVEGTEKEQDLTLSEFGGMTGAVTDADGNVSGGTVNVVAEGTTDPVLYTATTGVDGTYSILNVAPGDYDVWFEAANHVTASTSAVTITAAQVATEDKVLGQFAAYGGTISDDLAAPINGAVVEYYSAYPGDGPDYTDTTGADGIYAIAGIAPGTYQVKVSAAGKTTKFAMDRLIIADADVANDDWTLITP